jgi:hypothetical protein
MLIIKMLKVLTFSRLNSFFSILPNGIIYPRCRKHTTLDIKYQTCRCHAHHLHEVLNVTFFFLKEPLFMRLKHSKTKSKTAIALYHERNDTIYNSASLHSHTNHYLFHKMKPIKFPCTTTSIW